MSLKSQIISGISWSVAARIIDQIARLVISVILARLLLPEDFGTIGMVMVFIGYAVWIGDAGFGAAIIQRKEITEDHIQTVFTLTLGMGVILTLLTYLSAPLIARFYETPILLPLTRVIAFSFLFSVPGMASSALLYRSMKFQIIAGVNIVSTICSGVTAIFAALYGAGVWSLLVQMFIRLAITTSLNIYFANWRPHFTFQAQAFQDLWSYSINLFSYNNFNYWSKNVDNLLIGRIFGSESLGYYSRTYALMLLPIFQGVNIIAQVMFPALSSIQNDPERVKQIYLRMLSVIAFIICPMMLGLALVAEPFVLTLYGENWVSMVPLLEVLAPISILQSLSMGGLIYMSQGRTDWMFWWGSVKSLIIIASIIIGSLLGSVQTIVWCYALVNIIIFYPDSMIPGRLINMQFSEVTRSIFPSLAGALGMSSMVTLGKVFIPATWSSEATLFTLVFIGITAYALFTLIIRPRGWLEIEQVVKRRFQ